MNEEKIKEVFADEEFVKEFLSKETPEEAQALLAEKDIDVSVSDLCKLMDMLIAKVENPDAEAELDDEALEDVSGGSLALVGILAAVGAIFAGLYYVQDRLNTGRWARW
jgi:hypothetical protein